MENRVKVAVVGAGYFSQFHFDAWKRMDDVLLVAVCTNDQVKADEAAKKHKIERSFTNIQLMLDSVKPDLVDVISPPQSHFEIMQDLLNAGIPVICQKPFTRNLKEAKDVVRLSKLTEVPVIVHENFRFQPWYLEIKRQLELGSVGEPYQVSFRLRPGDGQGTDAYLNRQPYFQTLKKFLVHETAIHLIDVFRFLFGKIRHVYADLRRLNSNIVGEDAGIILFNFESNVVGLFDGNRLVDHPAKNRRLTMGEMMIEGSDGVLFLNGNGEIFIRQFGSNVFKQLNYEWKDRGFAGDCVYNLQRAVVNALRHDLDIVNRAEEYLANLLIEEAIYMSKDTGHKIDLEEFSLKKDV